MRRSLGFTGERCRGFSVSVKVGLPPVARRRCAAVRPRQPSGRRVARRAPLLCASDQSVLAAARARDRRGAAAALLRAAAGAARRAPRGPVGRDRVRRSPRQPRPGHPRRRAQPDRASAARFSGTSSDRVQRIDRGGDRAEADWRSLPKVTLIDLPSSSAANTRSFAEKAAAWSILGGFVPSLAAFRLRRARVDAMISRR